ncbi:alpha/beta hydrolase [Neptunomonas sp.]|uniref:alpha/beta hydrolase n=1 Tax=Neptunomonas sp. TaxID=1971898 RepID=UPI0025F12B85|nr:alpha/beta hydrolase [Neptunomonas sp.]
MIKLIFCALSLSLLLANQALYAKEVTTSYNNHTLNAELLLAEGTSLADGIVLITHGTLAHNKMELISTLQDLLVDSGISSLAINLSLGVDNRHGMYDCEIPHQHKHTDALNEISTWIDWLKHKGAQDIFLMGHSRGGNQTAWFSANNPEKVRAQILLAPATWNEQDEKRNYEQRYNQSLTEVLAKAKLIDKDTWLENTGFIYCPKSTVTTESFVNYYQPDKRFNTPYILNNIEVQTLVISGSEDKTVAALPEMMAQVSNAQVGHSIIEGADHYFRDLYADEVIDLLVEFLENQK